MIIKDVAPIRALFKARKLPVTQQRLAIYEALSSTKAHPGAESIYRELKPRYPALSLATVYKTLQAFERVGLAAAVVPRSEARYDAITGVHHHAICDTCGRIEDLFDQDLDRVLPPRAAGGFRVRSHSVHFYGRCARCAGRHVAIRKKTGGSKNV